MPDEWETAHDLNPNDASDGNKTLETDSSTEQYTALEVYLAELVYKITVVQNLGGQQMSGQQTTAIRVPYRPEASDDKVYTLNGSQVNGEPTNGIYIKNHKKTIIR
jgi:hypothetical protein